MKVFELRFGSAAELATEHEKNLKKSRAFVTGASDAVLEEAVELVLVHPDSGARLGIAARVVWVAPDGVGLEIVGLDAESRAQLAAFVLAVDSPHASGPDDRPDEPREPDEAGEAEPRPAMGGPRNIHERLRGLSTRERDELARKGTLAERVALERAFGGSVWEALLVNPQLTPAEVARIAKNASLPTPLVNTIVANAGWLGSPEVSRALLSNPRCSGRHLERVLRALRPAELLALARQCPYRPEVRTMVQRLTSGR